LSSDANRLGGDRSIADLERDQPIAVIETPLGKMGAENASSLRAIHGLGFDRPGFHRRFRHPLGNG
jgi:hypothetical protein